LREILFTADTHFGHADAILFLERPFESLKEMHDVLIHNWNSITNSTDIIYHLGDFGWWSWRYGLNKIFHALNGKKRLVVGNNDPERTLRLPWDAVIPTGALITIKGKQVFLSHKSRKKKERREGVIYLHGHQHCTGQRPVDVGVDCWEYRPVLYSQIEDMLAGR
jgi:calcineurin-like phosphoesterase family protein